MSGASRNRKVVKIDRDALRDARFKAHQRERHGIKGFLVTLVVLAAAGACLYRYRDSSPQQPELPLPDVPNTLPEPLPAVAKPVGMAEKSAPPAAPDVSAVSTVAVQPPVLQTDAEPQSRHDHLSLTLLEPSTRNILLKIGRLDGYPENTVSSFGDEFGQKTVSGTVVRINADQVRAQFPQSIAPGQSIVLNLPELERRNLLFRALSVRRDKPGAQYDPTQAVPSLRILCNGHKIWGRRLERQGMMVNALIPNSYLESYKNTITLQNDGPLPVVFDALWLETARETCEPVNFAIRDWQQIPRAYQTTFAWNRDDQNEKMRGIPTSRDALLGYPMRMLETSLRNNQKQSAPLDGYWPYRNLFVDFREQEKVALYFLEKAVGWYFYGGRGLTLGNVTGTGRFFSTTGQLYPSAYALWTVSRLFEGKPRRLPLNVMASGNDDEPLDQVYWMATQNKPGVASIIVTKSRFGSIPAGKVRIACALPWNGPTEAVVYNGIYPAAIEMAKPTYRGMFIGDKRQDDPNGVYERNRQEEKRMIRLTPNGKGGLLNAEFDITDCLYLRLVKPGTPRLEPPEHNPPVLVKTTDTPKPIKMAGSVTESRDSGLLRRKQLPIYFGTLYGLCANYRVSINEATKAAIGDQAYVVPETAQSVFCDIDHTAGPSRTAEGAALPLYSFHENIDGKTLSFWVYPHLETSHRFVSLRLALGSWQQRLSLKSGQWQRVELNVADLAGETERHLHLLGPSDYDRPGAPGKIRFEFNGFTLLDPAATPGRYMDVRSLPDGRLAMVLLGQPGGEGEARHNFSRAISVNTVTNISSDNAETDVKWTYNSDAQRLELTGLQFPETTDESVLPYLNHREKQHCQQGLTPVVLIAEVDT